MDTKLTKYTAFHPQKNGQTEVVNRMIMHIRQQIQDILQKSIDKYKQGHDQHQVPHKFQVGEKNWLHLQKEFLTGPHQKLLPLYYGSYTITKVVGDNAFELNIPPFLGLHPVFNVALLQP